MPNENWKSQNFRRDWHFDAVTIVSEAQTIEDAPEFRRHVMPYSIFQFLVHARITGSLESLEFKSKKEITEAPIKLKLLHD